MLVRMRGADLIIIGLSCLGAGMFIGMAFDDIGSARRLLVLAGAVASLLTAVIIVRDAHSKASPPA